MMSFRFVHNKYFPKVKGKNSQCVSNGLSYFGNLSYHHT
jgi:hypothetical protein